MHEPKFKPQTKLSLSKALYTTRTVLYLLCVHISDLDSLNFADMVILAISRFKQIFAIDPTDLKRGQKGPKYNQLATFSKNESIFLTYSVDSKL